jgi:predicted Zn-dependent protease
MDRLAALREILARDPGNIFARYGLALEHSRAGQIDAALAEFNTLLDQDPGYVAAYQMAGQMLASAARREEAQAFLRRGMAAAERAGNAHARSEMESLLDEISR